MNGTQQRLGPPKTSTTPKTESTSGGSTSAPKTSGPVIGRMTSAFSNGIVLGKGDTIGYTKAGSGFKTKLVVTELNGESLKDPIELGPDQALTLLTKVVETDTHKKVEKSKGRDGDEMVNEARQKNAVVTDDKNPDTKGGTSNSYFSRPKLTKLDPDGTMHVELGLHTLNVWDRIAWKVRVGPKGGGLVSEDKSWWANPAWKPSDMSYKFKEGFTGLGSEGTGEQGVRRTIKATVPGSAVKKVYGEDLSRLDDASIVCFGMEVYYGGGGPTTATKEEFSSAYTANVATAHQYGLGATSSPEAYGIVDLEGHDLKKGEWLTEEEIWKQDIPDNPSPNIRLPMPEDYGNKKLTDPMAPKDGMKIATRVENEATLKVSSLAKLQDIIRYLGVLAAEPGKVEAIMSGDETLGQFDWTVSSVEDNSMVFTDVYLDDPGLTALKSGIGIRKRSSDTATKLNVKTGPGYNVGELNEKGEETDTKSDIYRRHEIGYDLAPEAKIEDIGAFLDDGVKHYDPWNRGGEQVNSTLPKGESVDFSKLQGQMVLQGDRKKFNLKATHKESGGAINIEISCDHTIGRKFSEFEKAKSPKDLFTDMTGKYKQAFNVEMELEHLGPVVRRTTRRCPPRRARPRARRPRSRRKRAHRKRAGRRPRASRPSR